MVGPVVSMTTGTNSEGPSSGGVLCVLEKGRPFGCGTRGDQLRLMWLTCRDVRYPTLRTYTIFPGNHAVSYHLTSCHRILIDQLVPWMKGFRIGRRRGTAYHSTCCIWSRGLCLSIATSSYALCIVSLYTTQYLRTFFYICIGFTHFIRTNSKVFVHRASSIRKSLWVCGVTTYKVVSWAPVWIR